LSTTGIVANIEAAADVISQANLQQFIMQDQKLQEAVAALYL